MSQENVERVRAVYAEWGRGNFRAGGDLWDRRVQFIPVADLPEGGEYVGPRGVTHFMRDFLQPWTDFTIAAQELIEAGDSVVVAAHHRGVGRESGLVADLPQQFHVWTFRGPAVTRFEAFRDRAEALAAVGLSE
jgi:ketosteroid isomerase-like protein